MHRVGLGPVLAYKSKQRRRLDDSQLFLKENEFSIRKKMCRSPNNDANDLICTTDRVIL